MTEGNTMTITAPDGCGRHLAGPRVTAPFDLSICRLRYRWPGSIVSPI